MKRTIAAAIAAAVLASCSGTDSPPLSAEAEEGRALAGSSGCTSCHGQSGEGIVGPPWVGLYESTVELEDGSELVADAEYLERSIKDPQADIVAGYPTKMPINTLTDQEVDALVAYIEALR